jgi:uncharacterized membrane protein YhaH (DUF805 family)
MGFAESVQTVLSKYADFKGRASRPEYWWYFLAQFILVLILEILLAATDNNSAVSVLLLAVSLALLLPSLAVGVRRLHDTDKVGWWILLGLIPVIGTIVLIVFFATPGTDGDNRFGPAPTQ